MGRVAETLAPGAEHVIFGHTHRPGPLPGDDEAEWTHPTGTRLWNSGCWCHERAFSADRGAARPLLARHRASRWTTTGPPRVENVLREWSWSLLARPEQRGAV